MIKQTTNSFLMAKKTELLDRDCSLPMDEKKIRVCVYACNSVHERRSFVTRINCRNHRSFYKISKPFFIPNITIPTASLSLSFSFQNNSQAYRFSQLQKQYRDLFIPPPSSIEWPIQFFLLSFFLLYSPFFFFPQYLATPPPPRCKRNLEIVGIFKSILSSS